MRADRYLGVMQRIRRSAQVKQWAVLFALLALLARVAIPAGWMPAGDGSLLAPCPAAAPVAAMPASHMHAMHAGKHKAADEGDRTCPFAAFACAVATPDMPDAVAALAPAATLAFAPLPLVAAVGAGLVAPPPPQTGPPASL